MTPDICFKKLLKKNNLTDKVTVEYTSGAQRIVTLFMSGKATRLFLHQVFATAKFYLKKLMLRKFLA